MSMYHFSDTEAVEHDVNTVPDSGDFERVEIDGQWYVPERTCGEWRGDPRPDAIGHAAEHEDDELWCEHCDIELDEEWAYCPYCGARVVSER